MVSCSTAMLGGQSKQEEVSTKSLLVKYTCSKASAPGRWKCSHLEHARCSPQSTKGRQRLTITDMLLQRSKGSETEGEKSVQDWTIFLDAGLQWTRNLARQFHVTQPEKELGIQLPLPWVLKAEGLKQWPRGLWPIIPRRAEQYRNTFFFV